MPPSDGRKDWLQTLVGVISIFITCRAMDYEQLTSAKLQEMASSNSTDIEDLLSRAKMISVKLGLKVSDWIEYELNLL
jgi:hypothetical protein